MEADIRPLILRSKVKATNRYRKFLEVSSLFMTKPLTKVEMSLLDEFYQISGGKITTEYRKIVRENLDMSSEQVNNYIGNLRKRGIIIDDEINSKFLINIPESEIFAINIFLQVEV